MMAVLDIRPATKGHTIVFPKQHVASFTSLSSDHAAQLMPLAQQFVGILEEVEGCVGVNVLVAQGSAAGQQLDHVLLHVIPRYKDDGLRFSWEGKPTTTEELQTLFQQLQPKLASLRAKQTAAEPPPSPSPVFGEDDAEPAADF